MLTELYIPLFSVDNVNQALMHFNLSIEGVRVAVLQPDQSEPIQMLSRCSISFGKTKGRAIFHSWTPWTENLASGGWGKLGKNQP